MTARAVALRAIRGEREKDLEAFVKDAARLFGWERYHTHRSDFSPSGYPDETLCQPPRLIVAELKSELAWRKKDHGCSPEQLHWLHLLNQCPGVEVYLWRPAMVDEIADILRPGDRSYPPATSLGPDVCVSGPSGTTAKRSESPSGYTAKPTPKTAGQGVTGTNGR